MKNKIVLAFACSIAIASTAHAQIKKGSVLLGGSVSIATQKRDYENPERTFKSNAFGFTPAAGKAIRDNLILGVDVQYTYMEQDNDPDYTKSVSIGGGVFLRKYWEVLNRFYIFGQGRLGASHFRTKAPNGAITFDSKGFDIRLSIAPGISYAVSKRVHLESSFSNLLNAGYSHEKAKIIGSSTTQNDYKASSFNFSGAFSNETEFALGVRVLLSKS